MCSVLLLSYTNIYRRAHLLQGEYKKKARDVDRRYVGIPEDQMGPVEARLDQYGDLQGLVVGAFGEGSDDLHNLVQILAETRIRTLGMARGTPGTEEEQGVIVGQIRRRLSVVSVRAQAECLMSRMSHIGEGANGADKRRQWIRREEDIMRKERTAQWLGRVRGSRLVRKGQFQMN